MVIPCKGPLDQSPYAGFLQPQGVSFECVTLKGFCQRNGKICVSFLAEPCLFVCLGWFLPNHKNGHEMT